MENKIITIYELMGFINDNKAPKEIKYYGIIYKFNDNNYYLEGRNELKYSIFYRLAQGYMTLNDTVEILTEENDEWEDIEEYDLKPDDWSTPTQADMEIQKRLNVVIKNQKYLKAMVESLQRPFTDEIRVDIPKWIVDPKKEKLESKDE